MECGAVRLIRYPASLPVAMRGNVIATLGSFDGIHIGHQCLLNRVNVPAATAKVVISFYPHPIEILRPGTSVGKLASRRQTLELLKEHGVSVLYLIRFSRSLASMSAEDFVRTILVGKLGISELIVGPDARIGKDRSGTPEVMRALLESAGATLTIHPFVNSMGERSSSQRVRARLMEGNVKVARELLGRYYSLLGRVVHGAGRGRSVGIPTANLYSAKQILPLNGVYATFTKVGHSVYPSVTNIGVRPTFSAVNHVSSETHIMGVKDLSLYGRKIEVYFVERIRDERKFESIELLLEQINLDINTARGILTSATPITE